MLIMLHLETFDALYYALLTFHFNQNASTVTEYGHKSSLTKQDVSNDNTEMNTNTVKSHIKLNSLIQYSLNTSHN